MVNLPAVTPGKAKHLRGTQRHAATGVQVACALLICYCLLRPGPSFEAAVQHVGHHSRKQLWGASTSSSSGPADCQAAGAFECAAAANLTAYKGRILETHLQSFHPFHQVCSVPYCSRAHACGIECIAGSCPRGKGGGGLMSADVIAETAPHIDLCAH